MFDNPKRWASSSDDSHGEMALHYTAASFFVDVITCFFGRGADTAVLDLEGKTPLVHLEKWMSCELTSEKGQTPEQWRANAKEPMVGKITLSGQLMIRQSDLHHFCLLLMEMSHRSLALPKLVNEHLFL
jgi:hypothetical protein